MSKKEIPEMLNVLTIVTLGYSSMRIISGIFNFFMLDTVLEEVQGEMSKVNVESIENPFLAKLFTLGTENIDKLPVFTLISVGVAILCVISALLMRKLQKSGFYLYVTALALEVTIPILIIDSGLATGMILLGSVFSILFIILYGVNLKHMR